MAETDITITDIVTDYGAYYKDGGQNQKDLIRLQKQPSITPGYATPIVTDDTIYRAPQAFMDEIVQPWQSGYTPKGGITFKPNDIPTYKMKIDTAFHPDVLEESYLGFMADPSQGNSDRAKWPFVKWFVEVYVLEQYKDDLENKVYGKGIYAAPTPGTAGAAVGSMNGLSKIITDGLVGDMTAVSVTSPLARSTAFDGIEEIFETIEAADPLIFDKECVLGCDPQIARWYIKDRRDTLGGNTNENDTKKMVIDGYENVKWCPMPSLRGTGELFVTPKKNFVHITPKKKMRPIKVESAKREVAVMADWREGFGFLFNELVYSHRPA